MKNRIGELVFTMFLIASMYMSISTCIFMWRNPKANSMCIIREFKQVVTFEKLATYQK